MRFGCCGSMIAVEPDGTGVEIIEELSRIGYDYIELSLCHIAKMVEEEFYSLKNRVSLSGIRCETCNNFFPADIKLTGLAIDMCEILKYVEKALGRAEQLGVEYVVFGSGPSKTVHPGFPMDKAFKQLVLILREIASVARDRGICIVIEPLREKECNIINTVEEAIQLASEVGRDNVKILADYYHMCAQQENPDIILKAGELIKHVHFAKSTDRTFPKCIEEDTYMPFIQSLKKIGYSQRVSIEAYSQDFISDAVASLQFLKRYFD